MANVVLCGMKSWELIDAAPVPDSGAIMRLMRQGGEVVISVNHRELMRNTAHSSEDALAELACERLVDQEHSRLVIGGLGMGFTLASALSYLGPEAQVVVAELVPAVVRWNRKILGDFADHPLDDPRSEVYEGDVRDLIGHAPARWDAILLDVDNGPTGFTRDTNNQLYSARGLDRAFGALKPRGLLAVWSAAPAHAFGRRLERAGFSTECVHLWSRGRQVGRRHVVWIGRRS